MSKPTDAFGNVIINAFRNPTLYFLNGLLSGKDDSSPEAAEALKKLSDPEKDALRAALTSVFDKGIASLLYSLDDAANTRDGLAVTFEKKPLTTGGYEFGELFPEWLKIAAHHDGTGKPNDKAIK